jgi:hypothetical protein
MADGEGAWLVAVVVALGGAGGIAAAVVVLINAWAKNRRTAEKNTVARQGELLDRYEKTAAVKDALADRVLKRATDCEEKRARWEEWGQGMQGWAQYVADVLRKDGKDPGPIPRPPPRVERPEHDDDDFDRRTTAQTSENLKALADKIKSDGGSAT